MIPHVVKRTELGEEKNILILVPLTRLLASCLFLFLGLLSSCVPPETTGLLHSNPVIIPSSICHPEHSTHSRTLARYRWILLRKQNAKASPSNAPDLRLSPRRRLFLRMGTVLAALKVHHLRWKVQQSIFLLKGGAGNALSLSLITSFARGSTEP
jgi:hypothetical protein